VRCVYTDLDGTLLGKGASLFRTAEGDFTLLAARALEACHRAGAEVVIKSGRRRAQVMEDARLIGQTSDWARLDEFLIAFVVEPAVAATVFASSFASALELVREGVAEIHQKESFAPIYMRKRVGGNGSATTHDAQETA